MSYLEDREKYFKLFSDYCNSLITAVNFEKDFSMLWEASRDEMYERRKDWERRFDSELLRELDEGKISHDEFNKRWNDLWGMTDDVLALSDILNRTYTTCDCFDPDIPDDEADPPFVLSEKLFRGEVLALYHELTIFMKKHSDT